MELIFWLLFYQEKSDRGLGRVGPRNEIKAETKRLKTTKVKIIVMKNKIIK